MLLAREEATDVLRRNAVPEYLLHKLERCLDGVSSSPDAARRVHVYLHERAVGVEVRVAVWDPGLDDMNRRACVCEPIEKARLRNGSVTHDTLHTRGARTEFHKSCLILSKIASRLLYARMYQS